ncbi:hypothetical protein ES703_66868 [subsurface metagenome]
MVQLRQTGAGFRSANYLLSRNTMSAGQRHHCFTKEACIKTIFRYAHVYPRALALMESGKINVKPLITRDISLRKALKPLNMQRILSRPR